VTAARTLTVPEVYAWHRGQCVVYCVLGKKSHTDRYRGLYALHRACADALAPHVPAAQPIPEFDR